MRSLFKTTLGAAVLALTICTALAQQPVSSSNLSTEEVEKFLLTAKVGGRKAISVGVAQTSSALLSDGKLEHRGHIATIDVAKPSFQTATGTEINFKDSWKYNVAAYELAKLLEFPMVPPSVERKIAGDTVALTWWIDDAMMEGDRLAKKLQPPDVEDFNNQMYAVRVFNQLIYNVDANLTNLLVAKDWKLWMIDHTRSFRLMKTLENPKNLVKSDRKVLAKMRELNKPLLNKRLGQWLSPSEIDGVLARRDKIVAFFDKEIAAKGERAILFDLTPRKY